MVLLVVAVLIGSYPYYDMPNYNGLTPYEITLAATEAIPPGGNTFCSKPALYLQAGANCGGRPHYLFYALQSAGYIPVRYNDSTHSIIYEKTTECYYDAFYGNYSCDKEYMRDYKPYPDFTPVVGWWCTTQPI